MKVIAAAARNFPYAVDFNDRATWKFEDEFATGESVSGRIGSMGWNGSGTFNVTAGTADHPGLFNVSTGGSSGTVARINGFGNQVFVQSKDHGVIWHLRPNSIDAFTLFRCGSSDGWATNPANNNITFERLEADTNIFCVCRASAVQTRVDSGIAFAANFMSFAYQRVGSSVLFFIDGVLVATITTNIPSAQAGFGLHIRNNEALAKTLDLDLVKGYVLGLARA